MNTLLKTDMIEGIHALGDTLASNALRYDRDALFVEDNYHLLQEHGYLTAMIPEELGGAGISHAEMCKIIETIALYCSSTALAMSMHQHLVATTVWKYRQGQGGEELLSTVVRKNLVLISTGARDWLESNGELRKVQGGYLLNAHKFFASQSAFGDVAVTSAPFTDAEGNHQVLHFSVPMISEGVSLLDDWDTMGMRGTGSQTIVFKEVFVPASAITLVRPQGEFHPFWNVVLAIAMPLIMSAYVGIAQKAFNITQAQLKKQPRLKPHVSYQLGEMYNLLTALRVQHQDMIGLTNNLDFQVSDQLAVAMLSRKTNVAKACIGVVSKAFETLGGKAYYKKSGLEMLFRDVQAAQYHPLAEKDQQLFVGDFLLGQN